MGPYSQENGLNIEPLEHPDSQMAGISVKTTASLPKTDNFSTKNDNNGAHDPFLDFLCWPNLLKEHRQLIKEWSLVRDRRGCQRVY